MFEKVKKGEKIHGCTWAAIQFSLQAVRVFSPCQFHVFVYERVPHVKLMDISLFLLRLYSTVLEVCRTSDPTACLKML